MDGGRPRARRLHVPLGSAATRRLYFQSGANRSCCMTTFVLLHGGGMGGWTWKYVRPLLQKAGHEVLSPTFTGFGERIHLISRDISNSVHVTDIVNVLNYEDVEDAVIVAHSYAGTVATGVVAQAGDRIQIGRASCRERGCQYV